MRIGLVWEPRAVNVASRPIANPSSSLFSCEKRPEGENNVINQIKHLLERFEQRLTLSNPRLSKRYDEVTLQLLLHFRTRDGEEFVACLQREDRRCERHEKVGPVGIRKGHIRPVTTSKRLHDGSAFTWRDAAEVIRVSHCDQQAVLVDVVKFVEQPERVVPTFVWFDRVDYVYSILPHALYFSSASGFVYRGTVKNRERCPKRGIFASNQDQLMGQVVQRTSEIVQSVAGDCRKRRRSLWKIIDVKRKLARLRIALASDYIWLGEAKPECIDFGLQVVDVLFGPFDFYADKSESFVSRHKSTEKSGVGLKY